VLHYYEVQAWALPYIKAARAPPREEEGQKTERPDVRKKKREKTLLPLNIHFLPTFATTSFTSLSTF
jgi:hypothetical protein